MIKEYFDEVEYNNLKETNDLLYKCLELTTKVFKDKVDKGGFPYIIHLLFVYSNVYTYEEKIVALLHDVIEDTDISDTDLKEFGVPDTIINSVLVLTKNKKDTYEDYIDRIVKSDNKLALSVKLADLRHNIDVSRIKEPKEADFERVRKRYNPAYIKISSKLDELNERKSEND